MLKVRISLPERIGRFEECCTEPITEDRFRRLQDDTQYNQTGNGVAAAMCTCSAKSPVMRLTCNGTLTETIDAQPRLALFVNDSRAKVG
jgi:hypothetical protein